MPRGGRRPGAGRKPTPAHLRGIDGGANKKSVLSAVPTTNASTAIAEIEEFDAPDDLTAEERAVWLKQAPHAFKSRTLNRATALSFERYCKAVVWERKEAASSARGGSNHRGLLRQINAYELQFLLTPCGKAMYAAEDTGKTAPVNPLTRFLSRAK